MPSSRELFQQAWVVDDIEAAAARWSRALGIGPFFTAEYRPEFFTDVTYRGAPGVLEMRTAICYAGNLQVELIQPTGPGPSCYRETVAVGTEGFHHICLWTHDLEPDLAGYRAQGMEVAVSGRVNGGPRFAYVDATATLGCFVELLEHSARLQAVFDGWRDTCAAWQGGELFVRR